MKIDFSGKKTIFFINHSKNAGTDNDLESLLKNASQRSEYKVIFYLKNVNGGCLISLTLFILLNIFYATFYLLFDNEFHINQFLSSILPFRAVYVD